MMTRSLTCLGLLLSLSGCAAGPLAIAADVLGGLSMASLTVSGKGLGDQAISAAAGKDCRVLEGMMRSDRGICEDYKTAAATRILIETAPPPMPEIAIGQPFSAQPAIARLSMPAPPPVAQARLAEPAPPVEKLLAAAQKEEKPAARKPTKKDAPAAAEEATATAPAAPENPAVVMESEDSLKLAFGGGHSDKEVMAQLHAAIAAWRDTDRPPPPAEPAEAAATAAAPAAAKDSAEAGRPAP